MFVTGLWKEIILKRLFILLTCAFALSALSGCIFVKTSEVKETESRSLPPEHIVLKATGPAGQEFSGTLKVDGEAREIQGTSPWELPLDCNRLSGRIKKTKGDGSLEFTITRESNGWCSFSASPNCRFDYSQGGIVVSAF